MKWVFGAMVVINLLTAFARDFIWKDTAKSAYAMAWAAFFLTLYLHDGGTW